MYREWKKIGFPKGYYVRIWEQSEWEVNQEIDGKMRWEKMEDIVGGEEWQEKVHNREEWKKLLRTARNRRLLHMPMEWMNEWQNMTVIRYGPIATYTLKIQAASCSAIRVATYRATLYCPGYNRSQSVKYPIWNKNLSNTKIFAHVFAAAKQLMIIKTR